MHQLLASAKLHQKPSSMENENPLKIKLQLPKTGEGKPFVCEICSKRFSCGKGLGGHKRVHLVKEKADNDQSMENSRHQVVDEPKVNWLCAVCDAEFRSRNSLSGHMKKHPTRSWRGLSPPIPESQDLSLVHVVDPHVPRDPMNLVVHRWYATRARVARERAQVPALLEIENGVPSETERSIKRKRRSNLHESSKDGDGSDVVVYVPQKEWPCNLCERSFASYQALGGHKGHHYLDTKREDRDEEYLMIDSSQSMVGYVEQLGLDYQCQFCAKVFPNGQSYGGHKRHCRSVAVIDATPYRVEVQNENGDEMTPTENGISCSKEGKNMHGKELFFKNDVFSPTGVEKEPDKVLASEDDVSVAMEEEKPPGEDVIISISHDKELAIEDDVLSSAGVKNEPYKGTTNEDDVLIAMEEQKPPGAGVSTENDIITSVNEEKPHGKGVTTDEHIINFVKGKMPLGKAKSDAPSGRGAKTSNKNLAASMIDLNELPGPEWMDEEEGKHF